MGQDLESSYPRRVLTLTIDMTPMEPYSRLDTHLEVEEGQTPMAALSMICEVAMALGGWAQMMATAMGTHSSEVTSA